MSVVERLGDEAAGVGEGDAEALAPPVHGQHPAPSAASGPGGGSSYPCAIVAKNSLLFFVRFIRSSRNSIASTGGMSARKFRSR